MISRCVSSFKSVTAVELSDSQMIEMRIYKKICSRVHAKHKQLMFQATLSVTLPPINSYNRY